MILGTYKSAVAFVLLNVLDTLLTIYVLQHGGEEFMPLARFAYVLGGTSGILIFKLVATSYVLAVLSYIRMKHLLPAINVILGIICVVNMLSAVASS